MRLSSSPDVLTARVSGEPVLLNLADKNYYPLSETAADVWAGLERGESRDMILASLQKKHDFSPADAEKEMDEVIDQFRERRLIADSL